MRRKGIILAGGYGTRLYPITKCLSKHLIPIYDKPMIYYSLSTLMLAGIKDILIICTSSSENSYRELLGDGSNLGLSLQYKIQNTPRGLAEAFIIGEEFIGNSKVALILGDNLFYGQDFQKKLIKANRSNSASIFSYNVNDPSRFGIVELNKKNNPLRIIEKPKFTKSNKAIVGLYFFNKDVVNIAKKVKPSFRGELEITDINNFYLKKKKINLIELGRGYSWFDTGTYNSLIEASHFVKTIQERQGLMIGCPEEIAYNNKWVNKSVLKKNFTNIKNAYAKYIIRLTQNN